MGCITIPCVVLITKLNRRPKPKPKRETRGGGHSLSDWTDHDYCYCAPSLIDAPHLPSLNLQRMPEERDRPLPSWLIPSTSKAKHGARHTFPNPGPSRSAPLTAGPSRPSSSRSTQPIEILSSDGDSDIAVLATPTTAKERSAARQRHGERQEAPQRRHDSDSSEGRPLMKERSRRTDGTQTSRSSHRYALDPPFHVRQGYSPRSLTA